MAESIDFSIREKLKVYTLRELLFFIVDEKLIWTYEYMQFFKLSMDLDSELDENGSRIGL